MLMLYVFSRTPNVNSTVHGAAAFCHIKDVRRETNIQQLWRQVFCSCRSEAVEQPFNWTATSWH